MELSRFSEPKFPASSLTAPTVLSSSTTSASTTRHKGGGNFGHELATPTSTAGRSYHGFLLAWDNSDCGPEGHVAQGRVHIDPHAPAGRRGPLPCATTHGALADGGVPTTLHSESILGVVMDGFQGGRGGGGRGAVGFILNWDGIPYLRPNTILYNALLSAYAAMRQNGGL